MSFYIGCRVRKGYGHSSSIFISPYFLTRKEAEEALIDLKKSYIVTDDSILEGR